METTLPARLPALAGFLIASLAAAPYVRAQHATPESLAKRRLPQWVDAVLAHCDGENLAWDELVVTIPEDPEAKKDSARVEVSAAAKLSRMSHLLIFSPGPSQMKNLDSSGNKRWQASYDVALDVPLIRSNDVEKLEPAPQLIGKLAEHLTAPGVRLESLLVSRPSPTQSFGRTVQRIPVRFSLSGPRPAVLTRLSELTGAVPLAFLRSLAVTPAAADIKVTARANLMVTPPPAAEAPAAAELGRVVTEAITAAGGADVKVTASKGTDSLGSFVSLAGVVPDADKARAVMLAALAIPGLKAYDELGWLNPSGTVRITGILHF